MSYAWEFGDGGSDVIASPEHTYAQPGLYTVTLELRDKDKQQFMRKVQIRVD